MTLPAWVAPQLATLVSGPPPGDDWVHEIKLDGYRILLRIERGRAELLTRNRPDWTARFPTVAAAALPVKEALLDGEIVVLDAAGVSSFQALQQASDQIEAGRSLVYVAFDLLFLDGRDLHALPLVERKARLARLVKGRRGRLRYSEHFDAPGQRVYARACRQGLEVIVSKLKHAPYSSGRGRAWLKVKCVARQELVPRRWPHRPRRRQLLDGVAVHAPVLDAADHPHFPLDSVARAAPPVAESSDGMPVQRLASARWGAIAPPGTKKPRAPRARVSRALPEDAGTEV